MIEWTHAWKQIKVNLTEKAWNNLGQLTWTLGPYPIINRSEVKYFTKGVNM